MESDIWVPVSAALSLIANGAMLVGGVLISINPERVMRYTSVEKFQIELLRDYPSSQAILVLSHFSQLLMLTVPVFIMLTYVWPASSALCAFYWKATTIAYTAALYAVKWIYEIRAYTVCYQIEDHPTCKRISRLFRFQCVCCSLVLVALVFLLHGEDPDGLDNAAPCKLSFEMAAVWGPIGLMFMDAVLWSAFTWKLLQMVRKTQQQQQNAESTRSKSLSEMQATILYQYVLTLACIAVCITDYTINVVFMDSYLKLIAVVLDSTLVTLCNFLMVNDKMSVLIVDCARNRLRFCCGRTALLPGIEMAAAGSVMARLMSASASEPQNLIYERSRSVLGTASMNGSSMSLT